MDIAVGTQEEINECVEKFGYLKVNLPRDSASFDSGNGEGCWAVPCSEEDDTIGSSEEPEDYKKEFYVYLCNSSVYYPPFVWGSKVRAQNRGTLRAVAFLDQLEQSE